MLQSIYKNIILLIYVYSYFCIRGISSKSDISKVKRIIVMPASKLGDLVCATPIFNALKKVNPHIHITLCATKFYKDLFEDHPCIDDYFEWDESKVFDNIKKIKSLHFDVAIITTPSFISSACLFLSGIKTIIVSKIVNGFSPYQTKSYNLILPLLTSVEHKMGSYAPREYLKLLKPLGVFSDNTTKSLFFSESDKKSVEEKATFVVGKKRIGIAPGVGNDIKKWDPVHFAKIADYIHDNYDATVYILGTKNDLDAINKMKEAAKDKENIVDVSGMFDLKQIKAFVYKLDLLIAVDTGLIYVAEALRIPTIDIIGSMDEKEQPPFGEKHKLVFLPNRIPEIHIMNARIYNAKEARRHIEEIQPDMVFPYIKELLS